MRTTLPAAVSALALLVTSCSGSADLEPSAQLEDMLPQEAAYPEGYDISTEDVTELEGDEDQDITEDFASIEPPECERALSVGDNSADVADGADAAQQLVTPDGQDEPVYTYLLFSEVDGSASAPGEGLREMTRQCSEFTGTDEDGTQWSMSFAEIDGATAQVPEATGAYRVTMSGDPDSMGADIDMTLRAASGNVEDTYFTMVSVTMEDSARQPSVEDFDPTECDADPHEAGFSDAVDECRAEAASERQSSEDSDFVGVLDEAVAPLR